MYNTVGIINVVISVLCSYLIDEICNKLFKLHTVSPQHILATRGHSIYPRFCFRHQKVR